jgi:hypothetical protein
MQISRYRKVEDHQSGSTQTYLPPRYAIIKLSKFKGKENYQNSNRNETNNT